MHEIDALSTRALDETVGSRSRANPGLEFYQISVINVEIMICRLIYSFISQRAGTESCAQKAATNGKNFDQTHAVSGK